MNGPDDLAVLVAECQIRKVITDYCRAVDRRDMELLRSVFHPDAIDDHGFFKSTSEEFVAWFEPRHDHVAQCTHIMGDCAVDVLSDQLAVAETYVLSMQRTRLPDAPAGQLEESRALCRMLDRFERRDGVWRIAHRQVVFESRQAWPVEENVFPDAVTVQRHSMDDPSYAFFAANRS